MGWSNVAASIIEATTVIVVGGTPGSGVFIYSGTPTHGNLIGSWAGQAGTDPYGNSYPGGLAASEATIENGVSLWTDTSNNVVAGILPSNYGPITLPNGAPFTTPPPPAGVSNAVGFYTFTAITISGTTYAVVTAQGAGGWSMAVLNPSGAVIGTPLEMAVYINPTTIQPYLGIGGPGVTSISLGTWGVQDPNGGAGAIENWHNLTLATGWIQDASAPTCQYRLLPDGNVQLRGTAQYTGSSFSSGITLATLGTSYRPVGLVSLASSNPGTHTSGWDLQVNSAGLVRVYYATDPGSTLRYVSLDNCLFSTT